MVQLQSGSDWRPAVDVYEALAYTVPGIIAHQSALKEGELMKILGARYAILEAKVRNGQIQLKLAGPAGIVRFTAPQTGEFVKGVEINGETVDADVSMSGSMGKVGMGCGSRNPILPQFRGLWQIARSAHPGRVEKMKTLLLLLIHAVITVFKLLGPGGLRAVVAENCIIKQQLILLNRSRKRAPNLTTLARFIFGLCTLLMTPKRLAKSMIALRPSTFIALHKALVKGYHSGRPQHDQTFGQSP